MFEQPSHTAQDALDLITENTAPLDFGSGLPVYRAAIKRLLKLHVPGLITHDLSAIPMNRSFVEMFFDSWDQMRSVSKKERVSRSQLKSRLLIIARRLEGVPVVRTTDYWEEFLDAIRQMPYAQNLGQKALISVTSSLRAAAVESSMEPSKLTPSWLADTMKTSSPKRRSSLKKAAHIIDQVWAELPGHLRPSSPFGTIRITSKQRKSLPLPNRVSEELEDYLAQRVTGTTAEGFTRPVTVSAGIKEKESTNIYRQAIGWLFDCLCVVGELKPGADIGLAGLARLDWLSKVAFEALADADIDDEGARVFPWNPIVPETIYSRTSILIHLFGMLHPDFLTHEVEMRVEGTSKIEKLTPDRLREILKKKFKKGMTAAHRNFCREIVQNRDQQRLFLNMHMICWSEAETRWKTFDMQGHHEQIQTMNVCILAAILSVVVNIPFRARTVTSIVLEGSYPDISLPKGQKRIEFYIAPERLKIPKRFDATLEDSRQNRPRQILDWFIAGPRRELLRNPSMLPAENTNPELLFCGVGRARYNQILTNWSEEVGLRMTTHMFRHGLASILINCCECPMEEAARMLGNTVAVTERQYAFQDLIRRRGDTLRKLEGYRDGLSDTHHPGRARKQKS